MFLMDENSSAGEFGTNTKYKDLKIKFMWHVKWKFLYFRIIKIYISYLDLYYSFYINDIKNTLTKLNETFTIITIL